jgi:hypothetical protein
VTSTTLALAITLALALSIWLILTISLLAISLRAVPFIAPFMVLVEVAIC